MGLHLLCRATASIPDCAACDAVVCPDSTEVSAQQLVPLHSARHELVVALQVDVAGLDKQMVALMHKQQQLQAALDRKEDLCQRLSQVCSQPAPSVLSLLSKQ